MKLTDYKVLTFDCYGTLIDWETGIWDAREDFRWTRALDTYLNHLLTRGASVDLVINGGLLNLWEVPEGISCQGPNCKGAQVHKIAETIVKAHALDLALLGRFARLRRRAGAGPQRRRADAGEDAG